MSHTPSRERSHAAIVSTDSSHAITPADFAKKPRVCGPPHVSDRGCGAYPSQVVPRGALHVRSAQRARDTGPRQAARTRLSAARRRAHRGLETSALAPSSAPVAVAPVPTSRGRRPSPRPRTDAAGGESLPPSLRRAPTRRSVARYGAVLRLWFRLARRTLVVRAPLRLWLPAVARKVGDARAKLAPFAWSLGARDGPCRRVDGRPVFGPLPVVHYQSRPSTCIGPQLSQRAESSL